MRGKNIKKHRAQRVKSAVSRVSGVAEYDRHEKVTIYPVSAQPPVSADQARSRADVDAFIVTPGECGNQVIIVSSLLLASPWKPPHDLALFKFASELNDSSRTLLYRCKFDLLPQ